MPTALVAKAISTVFLSRINAGTFYEQQREWVTNLQEKLPVEELGNGENIGNLNEVRKEGIEHVEIAKSASLLIRDFSNPISFIFETLF